MTEKSNKIITAFTKDVREIFGDHLRQIILYGSHARGQESQESDIDVMILADTGGADDKFRELRNAIIIRSVDLSIQYDTDISPVVTDITQFKDWGDVLPFYKNIKREGVILDG